MTEDTSTSAWRQRLDPVLAWLRRAGDLGLRERLLLLAGFAVLVMLRVPHAVWVGRFVYEEGSIFLSYAWHRDAWDALWRSFGGYLNLAANATTLLTARLIRHGFVDIANGPRITMGFALFFQVLPAALILWGRGSWLRRRWSVVASLLMIVLAPLSEEVWLNVLHIQYHLALCCGLILVLEVPVSVGGWVVQGLILFLAPLCGPGALVLGPLFFLRTLVERSPARLAQTAVLGIGGLIQLLVFFTPSPVRGQFLDIPTLASILFVRLGMVPVTGIMIGGLVGDVASMAYIRHGLGWWAFSGLSILGCLVPVYVGWRYRRDAAGWLIAAGLALAVASFGGGMINSGPDAWFNAGTGERYNFLPLALLGIALVAIAQDRAGRHAGLAVRLCGLVLLLAMVGYLKPIRDVAQGPDWSEQAAMWRQDHSRILVGWPTQRYIDLSDTDRPCPPALLATASMADPVYCESAWLATVKGEILKTQGNAAKRQP